MRARGFFLVALGLALVIALFTVAPSDLGATIAVLCVLAVPLALSVLALLDAARRAEWVWALAGRTRLVWMLAILFGAFVLPIGIFVSSWYLLRIRPELRDAEQGRLRDRP